MLSVPVILAVGLAFTLMFTTVGLKQAVLVSGVKVKGKTPTAVVEIVAGDHVPVRVPELVGRTTGVSF